MDIDALLARAGVSMVNPRALTWLVLATALGVAATPTTVLADSADDGQIIAHWESIRAPSVIHAVMIHARWHAAGEAYFRVDNKADVAAYSLSLITEVDRAAQFKGIDADTSAISHLVQITTLVRDSARETNRGTLTDVRAAAYQITIWHLTDGLSVDPVHVPNRAIRSVVGELLRTSKEEADCKGPNCAPPLDPATTAATLSVKKGNTVSDTALRIAIVASLEKAFNQRQYVNLRINGLGATLCPGEIDRVRVDEQATHSVLKSSCEFRRHDPAHKGDPTTAALPRLVVQRLSTVPKSGIANNTLITYIPLQTSAQEVEINWQINNDPGMIFMPASPSAPIITASGFADERTAAITIDPENFTGFQNIVQRSILPIFTEHGNWGLAWLALLFVVLLFLKDLLKALWRWLGKILRWAWYKSKAINVKASRNADKGN